jgi:general secretion pathway protein D
VQSNFNAKVLVSAAAIILAACQDQSPQSLQTSQADGELTLQQMLAENAKTEENTQIAAGMQAMLKGDYAKANRLFNVILIDDPLNSGVHTLNALTYQLMAKQGDALKYDLALAGYEQALKIDPNNTFASLQLGRIYAEKRDYINAQEQFSKVLLEEPTNSAAQFELASVSYHLGDLRTARVSIDRALRTQPDKGEYVRAAALIYAAAGESTQANIYLDKYKTVEQRKSQHKYLEKRLDDWAHLHTTKSFVVAQADTTGEAAGDAAGDAAPASDPNAAADAPAPVPVAPAADAPPADAAGDDDMVVIDVTVMRISENGGTSKGQNILENLTLSLAPWTYYRGRHAGNPIGASSIFPTNNGSTYFTSGNTTYPTTFEGGTVSGTDLKGTTAKLITQGISLGTINYSLNIANSENEYIEVIGRPTLTTGIGKKAEFFSGNSIKIAVSGNFGGNVTDTPVGFKLEVTPTSLQQEDITMDVRVEGSTLSETLPESLKKTGSQVFALLQSHIDTNIKMKLGETVILGGISERTQANSKSGVPLLQNIPGIQYLFSKEETSSERRSIVYMLTPRSHKAVQRKTRQYFAKGQEFGNRPNLTELEKRHKDWFDPGYHHISILDKLGHLYSEFRTGDLKKLSWHKEESLEQELNIIAGYLWY